MFDNFRKAKWCFLFVGLVGLLVGCSAMDTKQDADLYKNLSENEIFAMGEMAMAKHHFREATKHFEALEVNYPFGKQAEQSQLNLIYCYYQLDDYPSTIVAAQHFTHLYPRSEHADYAYYMKGLADFNVDRGFLQRILPIDPSERDVGSMRDSYNDFMMLLQLYPDSPYSNDARQHLVYLRNILAEHEMIVARYYFSREAYVAAADRASYVVQHYQHAPQVKAALQLMVAAYNKLQQPEMAQDAERVLEANFKD